MSIERYDPDAILADLQAHPTHRRYAQINKAIRDDGERWAKCLNCGIPFQITEQWDSEYHCSNDCGREYDEELRRELG